MAELESSVWDFKIKEDEVIASRMDRMCSLLKVWRLKCRGLSIEEKKRIMASSVLPVLHTSDLVNGLSLARIGKRHGAVLFSEAVDEVVDDLNARGEFECLFGFPKLDYYIAYGMKFTGRKLIEPTRMPETERLEFRSFRLEKSPATQFQWEISLKGGEA